MLSDDQINDDPKNDQSVDIIRNFSFEFSVRYTHHFEKITNRLLSVAFNNKQRMFIFLDALGLVTWEWRKASNQITRVYKYPDFEYKHLIDIIYCKNYNCYFAIKGDSTLIMLNRDFEEICTAGEIVRSILCMIYNSVNDELITCDIEGVKVWYLKSTQPSNVNKIKHLSNYKLQLKKTLKLSDEWIRRIQIDAFNYHMFCCTKNDLFIYDFNGNLLRSFKSLHDSSISCCVYSPISRYLLTGSEDASIKIWSLNGGFIEEFRGHSKTVTNLILNPYNSNLVISSSLDGSIKMWSLDVMQLIYEKNCFEEGIVWMGLTDDKLLYAACPTHMILLSIANFVDFWALSRNKILEIKSLNFSNREPRLIVRGEDTTIRVFKRDSAKSLTCVLPIPRINEFGHIKCIAYSRNSNIIYTLVDKSQELWLYFTKTNPATHIEAWNLSDFQEMQFDIESLKKYSIKHYGTLSSYKTVDYKLVNNDVAQEITSVCTIDSTKIIYFNGNDLYEDDRVSYLLLGRQNGTILFCDPLVKGKKYCLFYCDKDPIVEMYQDHYYNCLVTKTEQDKHYCVKYWSLPDLELKKEFYSLKSLNSFARIDDHVLVGHEDGTVELIKLSDEHKSSTFLCDISETNSEASVKYEHKESVKIIDASQSAKIYLSCSIDGNIKIWSQTKILLAEIYLDDTLSYACFLNKKSDIIVGWRNHLFMIYMDRILPELQFDFEEEDSFSEDSTIVEENNNSEDDEELPKEIDLDNYLYPHKIIFNTNGVLANVVEVPVKIEENNSNKNVEQNDDDQSEISTVPTSIFSTPRKSLTLFLPNVDLTLTSGIKQSDIRSYLIELFSQSFQMTKEANFPRFGASPGSTPTLTSGSQTPLEQEQPQLETNVEDQFTEISYARLVDQPLQTKRPLLKQHDSTGLQKKLQDNLPKSDVQAKITSIKIEKKPPAIRPKSSENLDKRIKKNTALVDSEPKIQSKKIIRRSVNEDQKQINEFKSLNRSKTRGNVARREVQSAKITIETDSLAKKNTENNKENLSKIPQNLLNRNRLIPNKLTVQKNISKIKENEYNDELIDFDQNRKYPLEEMSDKLSDDLAIGKPKKRFGKINEESPSTIEDFDRNIESIEPPDDKESESEVTSGDVFKELVKNRYDQINRGGTQSTSSQMIHSALLLKPDSKLNNAWDPTEGVLAVKKIRKENKPKILNYTPQELKKIMNLFEYYYGETTKIQHPNQNVIQKHISKDENKDYVEKTIKKAESQNQVEKNLDEWLEKYEKKRELLDNRLKSAQEKQRKITEDNTQKWLTSIAQKNHLIRPIDVQKPVKPAIRLIKSAVVTNEFKIENKRPKSVSFLNVELNQANKHHKVKVQEPYHVSQIEMDDILREVVSRNSLKSQSVSSYTMIPDIYFKKFKNFGRASPKTDTIAFGGETDSEYFSKINEFDEPSLFKSDSMNTGVSKKSQNTIKSDQTIKKDSKVRIRSCTLDIKSAPKLDPQKNPPRIESASSYRLSLKDFRLSSAKLQQETFSNPSLEVLSSLDILTKQRVNLNRSPQSIPSKCTRYKLLSMPEIKFEYKIPGFPERYLLPIRFPNLNNRILSSIARLKSARARARRDEERLNTSYEASISSDFRQLDHLKAQLDEFDNKIQRLLYEKEEFEDKYNEMRLKKIEQIEVLRIEKDILLRLNKLLTDRLVAAKAVLKKQNEILAKQRTERERLQRQQRSIFKLKFQAEP